MVVLSWHVLSVVFSQRWRKAGICFFSHCPRITPKPQVSTGLPSRRLISLLSYFQRAAPPRPHVFLPAWGLPDRAVACRGGREGGGQDDRGEAGGGWRTGRARTRRWWRQQSPQTRLPTQFDTHLPPELYTGFRKSPHSSLVIGPSIPSHPTHLLPLPLLLSPSRSRSHLAVVRSLHSMPLYVHVQ